MQLSLVGFLFGLVLLALPLYVCHASQTGLLRQALHSFLKMLVSLAVAYGVLRILVATDAEDLSPWALAALRMLLLLLFAAGSTALILHWSRVPRKQYLLPMGVGVVASLGVTLLWFWLLVVGLHHGFVASYLIPLTGLLAGGLIETDRKALASYHTQLTTYHSLRDLLLGNGATSQEAHALFLRRAVQRALVPSVRQMATLLLLASPVVLWTLLLAGMPLMQALAWQVLIAVAILFCNVLSIIVMSVVFVELRRRRSLHQAMPLLLMALLLAACQPSGQQKPADEPVTFYQTSQQSTANDSKPAVIEYELPAPLKDRSELIIRRDGYTTSYNSTTKQPNWVAWHLTKNRTYGSADRHENMFAEDTSVPSPRATLEDYYNHGYDRGHMCPAADNKWNEKAMRESFLLTNICPQNHGLNKYEWNDVEILCRDWARKYGAVDIVCGPIFSKEVQQKTIGRNRVWVPAKFFKVVLCRKGTPKAIGFIYDNKGQKMPMKDHVYSVDEVEKVTGIDFFPSLADDIERRIEAAADLSDWKGENN